jgi:DNA-binding MarR family transcriptional regulator
MNRGAAVEAGEMTDGVDAIVAAWQVERPDLDTSAKQITGRIIRLAALFEEAYSGSYTQLGISAADFGILSALRRAGRPFRLSPTEIARQRMITSGGLTPALDRLERLGMVERVANETDRRSRLVQLTDEGLDVIERAIEQHTADEHQLVAGIDDATRTRLVDALRQLLFGLEPR